MQPPVGPADGGISYGMPAYNPNPDMPSGPPAGAPPMPPAAGGKPEPGFDDLEARLRALQ